MPAGSPLIASNLGWQARALKHRLYRRRRIWPLAAAEQAGQFCVFTLACQVLPAPRSPRNGLPCPPSTHGPDRRGRLKSKASRSPRSPGTSSGCRHQELRARRNSSTAYDRLFAAFRSSTPTPPNSPRMIHGLRGNLKSRSARPAMPWPHTAGARPDAIPATAPLNAYTWQRGRLAPLIRPPDRRCPDTLRRTAD